MKDLLFLKFEKSFKMKIWVRSTRHMSSDGYSSYYCVEKYSHVYWSRLARILDRHRRLGSNKNPKITDQLNKVSNNFEKITYPQPAISLKGKHV